MKKVSKIIISIMILGCVFLFCVLGIPFLLRHLGENYTTGYVASDQLSAVLYDENYQQKGTLIRGTKVQISTKQYNHDNEIYKKISMNGEKYYMKENSLTREKSDIVKEKEIYVRTPAVIYYHQDTPDILVSAKKGDALKILGYNTLLKDGQVDMYKVQYDKNKTGYIYAKYTVRNKEDALLPYNENGIYDIHKERGDQFGGGSAANLDYYKEDKIKIPGNEMPKEARTIYINATSIKKMEDYIVFAKQNNINAFVIDVKENTIPAYPSEVMQDLSLSNYKKAVNTKEEYKVQIQKAKDAGIYIIGRITTFKDQYYALDHEEDGILDTRTGKLFAHNHSYWPSPYSRNVWEYNVKIALEAVKEFGFHEIQFDYIRFPDRVSQLEESGVIDLRNIYQEDKASAIQQFLMYARDELHKVGAYISADVFGEAANQYVTAYGQYWPAISNVVDVISAMPYPDHFNKYEFGFEKPVWTIPYELLKTWGTNYAAVRQSETPSPAIVRTWIQAYNTIAEPYIVYDTSKISDQIKGLYESGLTGGYITWNSGSSIDKYKQIAKAFQKEYIHE